MLFRLILCLFLVSGNLALGEGRPLSPMEAIAKAVTSNMRLQANDERVKSLGQTADSLDVIGKPRLFAEGNKYDNFSESGPRRETAVSAGVRVTIFDGGASRHDANSQRYYQKATKHEYDSLYTSYGTTSATIATTTADLYGQIAMAEETRRFLEQLIGLAQRFSQLNPVPESVATINSYIDSKTHVIEIAQMSSEVAKVKFENYIQMPTPELMTLPQAVEVLNCPDDVEQAITVGYANNPELNTVRNYLLSAEEKSNAINSSRHSPVVELSLSRGKKYNVGDGSSSHSASTTLSFSAKWSLGETDGSKLDSAKSREKAWEYDIEGTARMMKTDLRVYYLERNGARSKLSRQSSNFNNLWTDLNKLLASTAANAEQVVALLSAAQEAFENIKKTELQIFLSQMKIQRTLGVYADFQN
jgi:hypothetical protein